MVPYQLKAEILGILGRTVVEIPHVSRKDSSSEMQLAQMILSPPMVLCLLDELKCLPLGIFLHSMQVYELDA